MSELKENIEQNNPIEDPAAREDTVLTSDNTEMIAVSDDAVRSFDIADEAGPDIISGADVVKRSHKKLIIIITAIVVFLIAGCISAYAFIPTVKNSVKMLVNSSEDYYAWVEENNMDAEVDKFTGALGRMQAYNEMSMKLDCKLKSDAIAKLIESSGGSMEMNGMKIKLPERLGFDSNSAVIDGCTNSNGTFTVNGKDLISVNSYERNGRLYYQFPDLSDQYICIDPAKLIDMDNMDNIGLPDIPDSRYSEQAIEIIKGLLSGNGANINIDPKELNSFLKKYWKIAVKNVKNVDLEKNVSFEAGGVKCKYTKLTVKIDEGMAFSIVKEILKEVKNDSFVTEMVKNLGVDEDVYSAAVDNLLDQMGKYELSGGDDVLIMNVFVDSKGSVAGRTFETPDGKNKFGCVVAADKPDYGFTAYIDTEKDKVSIEGKAKENKDKYSGNAKVSAKDKADTLSIDFSDMICSDDLIRGSVKIDTSALSNGGLKEISLSFDEKDGNQILNTAVNYKDEEIIALSCEADRTPEGTITVFNEELPVFYYGVSDPKEYADSIKSKAFAEFYKRILTDLLGLDADSFEFNAILGNPAMIEQMKLDFAEQLLSPENLKLNGKYPDIIVEDDLPDFSGIDIEEMPADAESGTSDVVYDLSKVKLTVDGKEIKMGGKPGDLLKYVDAEKDKVSAGERVYMENERYTVMLSVYNSGENEAELKDCGISWININNGAEADFRIDGAGIGDDVKALAEKYGAELSGGKDGSIYIRDENKALNSICIYYSNGKIWNIDVSCSE